MNIGSGDGRRQSSASRSSPPHYHSLYARGAHSPSVIIDSRKLGRIFGYERAL